MAKTSIPNAVRPIRLEDYLPEFGDQVIYVWVNPPLLVLARRAELIKRAMFLRQQLEPLKSLADETAKERVESLAKDLEDVGEQMIAWLAEIWSKHADAETHFSPEDVKQLARESADKDPGFYGWLIDETVRLISEHRKKK